MPLTVRFLCGLLLFQTGIFGQNSRPILQSVVNAASYKPGPVCPGEMVVLFGAGIGPSEVVSLKVEDSGRVSTSLADVQVLFDGIPAPLIYASATQVAAVVPVSTSGKPAISVRVAYRGQVSDALTVIVTTTAPGVFTADSSGRGLSAATNSNGSYNGSQSPAAPGSWVTLYLTGVGGTDPAGTDGQIVAGIAAVTSPVSVKIGGRVAEVLYAGSAPGNVHGFAQVNVIVPPSLPYGGNLPLNVQIGSASSQPDVTLAVSGPPAPVPGPPQSVTANQSGSGQIVLRWTVVDQLATRFRIERRAASSEPFLEIGWAESSATSFTDMDVSVGKTYEYRVRAEGDYGLSAYSTTASVSIVTTPVLPPAPTLTVRATSPTQVRLNWTTSATGVVRFRLERKNATTPYVEIGQPGASSTTLDDNGLTPSTSYTYRMRVETNAGLSPYSAEAAATTLPSVPAAPSNLRASATASTQVNLTWTNNSADATSVRVEMRQVPSGAFGDVGAATTLSSTPVTNLQANTSYVFRVRAQNSAGYSAYSNEANVTTPNVPKTVFLIHGLFQGATAMNGLQGKLTGPMGIDGSRFRVDAGFDFSECANSPSCPSNCSISLGAQKLAQYIARVNPPGDIVLVGYSMGGLIARDLVANNWYGVLNSRKVAGLITLGTPNLGYPYTFLDRAASCTHLVLQMDGNWRSKQSQGLVVLSDYLLDLTNQWSSGNFPGGNRVWLAASGRSCSDRTRSIDPTTGCRDANRFSDGVVCDDSATFNINAASASKPTRYWQDPEGVYVHSNDRATILAICGNSGDPLKNPPLSNPPSPGPLFSAIKEAINAM